MGDNEYGIKSIRDILFPKDINAHLVTNVYYGDDVETPNFIPPDLHPNRYPKSISLVEDLPERLYNALEQLASEEYGDVIDAETLKQFIVKVAAGKTFAKFWLQFTRPVLTTNEANIPSKIRSILDLIDILFNTLTGKFMGTKRECSVPGSSVRMNMMLTVMDENFSKIKGVKLSKVLLRFKTSAVFREHMGQLFQLLRASESLCYSFPKRTVYTGFEGILAEVFDFACDKEVEAPWAIITDTFQYVIFHITLTDEHPVVHCSPIMDLCVSLGPGLADGKELTKLWQDVGRPLKPPTEALIPFWSLVLYMLLTADIDHEIVRKKLNLSVPVTTMDEEGWVGDGKTKRSITKHTRKLYVKCGSLDASPIQLVREGACPLDDKTAPYFHLETRSAAGWSTVFLSRSSPIVVKFDYLWKKDESLCKGLIEKELAVYERLRILQGWIIPRCFGEIWTWEGGKALVLSNEGPSLCSLKNGFCSLSTVEKFLLFAELYAIHRLGVCHRDFEERNVLRRGWCRFCIIDLAFAETDHDCPGLHKCRELEEVRKSTLELDKTWPYRLYRGAIKKSRQKNIRSAALAVIVIGLSILSGILLYSYDSTIFKLDANVCSRFTKWIGLEWIRTDFERNLPTVLDQRALRS